ncbi:sorbosone dehydrogenase family protein [Neolewinella lacunae]|uniref:Sorbosone dehydrogenase family protein n=1 Tax=Neolewinella lacunae TaxID=1517758 RepID=A0A923PPQ6_9BACT|nr:sorbosone dehydrogenase family protein [Neolewinella lacunae]MBC6995148.1 sorbosone dehydrogenase family protein [Neolewinella lacunae]MDN3634098.1 sorbosone dehydrogenase family protein [Neolewinella lacunae]
MKKLCYLLLAVTLAACAPKVPTERKNELAVQSADTVETAIGPLVIPSPYTTPSAVKQSKVIDWPADRTPQAPAGFRVERFADDLQHPRSTYQAENGDVFAVESDTRNSANQITLLRDTDGDGRPDLRKVFLADLKQPFGMLILDGYFYVANTDATYRYPYTVGQESLDPAKAEQILATPPQGYNNHWTRNLLASKDDRKIYVSVGSGSNVGENGMDKEEDRATIIEINPDGSGKRNFATGLRNPVGMDWNPITGELWTAVNERDKLGDNLVPDYATSVQENGFYGWPYSYFGQLPDPRWEEDPHTELVSLAIVPDVPLGPHTASLGFDFYVGDAFPARYRNGAFVGQHGSWNRANFSGYKVVFIPFDAAGKPQAPEDFLTGFIADAEAGEVYGRPVGVMEQKDGSLLVCDDDAGIIWRVSVAKR